MVFNFMSEVSFRPLQVGFYGGYEAALANKYSGIKVFVAIDKNHSFKLRVWGGVVVVGRSLSNNFWLSEKEGGRGGGCHNLLVCSLSHHFGGGSSSSSGSPRLRQ